MGVLSSHFRRQFDITAGCGQVIPARRARLMGTGKRGSRQGFGNSRTTWRFFANLSAPARVYIGVGPVDPLDTNRRS